MQKISVLFKQTYAEDGTTSILQDEVRPGNEWVLNGEGIATIKKDGSAALIKDGQLYVRYGRKLVKQWHFKKKSIEKFEPEMFKPIPEGSILCNELPDPITGHWPCWVPCSRDKPEHKYAFEAFDALTEVKDGTYELIGPTVQCNPYNLTSHVLYKHGSEVVEISDYSYEGLKAVLTSLDAEGLVFHHKTLPNVMAKLRRKDFNLKWNEQADSRNTRNKA